MSLLVTGGAGYIGSHTASLLSSKGHRVVVLDSLINGHGEALSRAGRLGGTPLELIRGDIRSQTDLKRAFAAGPFDAVVHFAGLKSVVESIDEPELYREVNISGTAALCEAMRRNDCQRLVFSSSAAVYGNGDGTPCREETPLAPLNPYGASKAEAEQVIAEQFANSSGAAVSLRYFNPVGAHPSAELGEDPKVRNNLAPVLLDVAFGVREDLEVFGSDYPTPDGSCIRDYIHIMDLARAHLAALNATDGGPNHQIYNVGTGRGSSVLDMLEIARQVTSAPIPARRVARREGDSAALIANVTKIQQELGWKAELGVREMLESAWAWRCSNPQGYPG
ncbi:MAG: UDP-glucose 4-epimerase GalE [Rickettsiales bacterium]|nr:UDP-glucose 4-epimerase GalE [Rickettsiales bacterium]|tara:strand:- start:44 stop:1051 length:1008 start_codon:yes stop_codon:yes gene_type:complete